MHYIIETYIYELLILVNKEWYQSNWLKNEFEISLQNSHLVCILVNNSSQDKRKTKINNSVGLDWPNHIRSMDRNSLLFEKIYIMIYN